MPYLRKIKKLLANAVVPPQDKELLINVFLQIPHEEHKALYELLSADPSLPQKLIHNYKSKQAAVEAASPEMWDKIIQEEEQTLREMAE